MLRDAVVKVGKKVTELGGMSRLGRIGEPEEIAMGNLFLISDMSTYTAIYHMSSLLRYYDLLCTVAHRGSNQLFGFLFWKEC